MRNYEIISVLTVGLAHADDQLGVKSLPESLCMHQLHRAILQPVLDVGKN